MLMIRRLLTFFLVFLPSFLCAQQRDVESLCKQIDEAIAQSPRYVAQREAKIAAASH